MEQKMKKNRSNFTYNVDMVFCIGCTGDMGYILDIIKNNALNFYNDVTSVVANKNRHITQLRVRVVAFRDYLADGDKAMMVTDFFRLPQDAAIFERCVRSLIIAGGGDPPNDGLEALAYAIKSKWDTSSDKSRQVILVFADESTHPLGYGASSPYYPKGMAKDFDELSSWWGGPQEGGFMTKNGKRLLLFAPDAPGWNVISSNWDNVVHFPGVENYYMSYQQILDAISNSI